MGAPVAAATPLLWAILAAPAAGQGIAAHLPRAEQARPLHQRLELGRP